MDMALNDDETFSQAEAPRVIRDFVCAVCHSDLSIEYLNAHYRVLIVCPDHGSVCSCGRVTRATVNIETERSYRKFQQVIRNLPDLWGELIEKRDPPRSGETRQDQNLRELGF